MRRSAYGGQALIEGMMIKGPERTAIAVRAPDGEIVVKRVRFKPAGPSARIPLLRGVVEFFRLNVQGMRAMLYAARLAGEDAEESPAAGWTVTLAAVLALLFSVGLFILLPSLLAGLVFRADGAGAGVLEGLLRLGVFTAYLWLVSRLDEMKRIWMYHGAEHKTIHCYEQERELTVENVRGYDTRHPRCGTSFLVLVMAVSVALFSLVGWHGVWGNLVLRLLLIPLVAGVSYELFRQLGRRENALVRLLRTPGLAFQGLTTAEPDDAQIEVAIAAFRASCTSGDEEAW